MKTRYIKAALALVALLATAPGYTADALFNPATDNERIVLAASSLADSTRVQKQKICESEKIGNKICVTCEYTAIGETSFNCYKIPKPESKGSAATALKTGSN